MKQYKATGLDGLKKLAEALLADFPSHRVFAFYGDMGAGKTTFVKNICKLLGVVDSTSSPTYSIVNEYNTVKEKKIYHFDFYRLKNLQEALDIGCEDYFFSGNYCFIEWPQIAEKLLPSDTIKFSVERNKETIVITQV